ncbi:hypothetical protein QL093DRAFT_1095962 [Fusarium oxysporum]|nr:hypothetical protein QL093DRAFT_1095962 [Fusarium oxysporum]
MADNKNKTSHSDSISLLFEHHCVIHRKPTPNYPFSTTSLHFYLYSSTFNRQSSISVSLRPTASFILPTQINTSIDRSRIIASHSSVNIPLFPLTSALTFDFAYLHSTELQLVTLTES